MKVRLLLVAAAVAGCAATFLPWDAFDAQFADGRGSRGWISFGAFVGAAACAMYRPTIWIRCLLFIAGGIAVSIAMLKIRQQEMFAMLHASSPDLEMRKLSVQIHPGHGVYLVIGSSLVLVLGALVWRERHPGEQPPPELPRAKLVR